MMSPRRTQPELVQRYRDLDYTVLVSGHGEQFAATHQQIRYFSAKSCVFVAMWRWQKFAGHLPA